MCFLSTTRIANAQEMKIYSGANLVMNGSVNLVANNTAFINNGIFTASTGTVSLTGNADTTVSYISGTNTTQFNNLTVNKSAYGIAIKSAAGIKNILTVSSGNLYADGNLTLLSDANSTARVAAVPPGAGIFGNSMVERYVPSRRAWRLMTAPVTSASTIYSSWQNNGVYTPGIGLLISGPGGGNGLDNGNAASLKLFDASSQSLIPVLNTHTSISQGNSGSADNTGYFVFVRGDRDINNFNVANSNVTTITSIGRLQTGAQTFSTSSVAGAFTLIGNPYASPINFNTVSRNNLVKRFYVWDPNLNTLGGYVTLDDIDNDGTFSKSVAGSSLTKDIQSSQAFFVETDAAGSSSLTINETDKSSSNNGSAFGPTAARPVSGPTQSIRIDLYLSDTKKPLILADGALAEFNNVFSSGVTNEDAVKFGNINESISLVRDGTMLAIERRPAMNSDDTIFLKLSKTTQRNYQLQLVPVNIYQQEMQAFFEDNYLNSSVPLSFSDTNKISFAVNADAASAAANRFKIVFRQLTVLPISFSSVKAHLLNDQVQIDWKVQDETNVVRYEVEHSVNGLNFTAVNTTDKNTSGNYSWTDANALAGKNFYRIKSINQDGTIKYSQVLNAVLEKNMVPFTIEPNPISGNSIQVHFANQPKGNYRFNLMSNTGQLIFSSKVQISNGVTMHTLNINSVLASGIYQLQIVAPDNTIQTQKVIK